MSWNQTANAILGIRNRKLQFCNFALCTLQFCKFVIRRFIVLNFASLQKCYIKVKVNRKVFINQLKALLWKNLKCLIIIMP